MAAGSGIAAGASAGSAFGPWGTAIGAVAGGLMDMASTPSAPAGPSNVTAFTDAHFDSSGWVVATSGATAEGTLKKSDSGMANAAAAFPWEYALAAGLVAMILWKRL